MIKFLVITVWLLLASAMAGPMLNDYDESTTTTTVDQCITIGGDDIGSSCTFPFSFHGVPNDNCTTAESPEGKPWCFTLTGWGYCPSSSSCGTLDAEEAQYYVDADEDPRSDCVKPGSLPNDCTPCREKSQCESGGFCCPYMKKCVKSSSQKCNLPIANCRPVCFTSDCKTCSPTDGSSYGNWGKPTCAGL